MCASRLCQGTLISHSRTLVGGRDLLYCGRLIRIWLGRLDDDELHLEHSLGYYFTPLSLLAAPGSSMIRIILLDLDDVLNTLAPCVLNAVGCPVAPDHYGGYPGEFGYAVQDVANHMLGSKYTRDSFWLKISQHTWATVPKSDFCDWLIEASRLKVGEENVYIATKPTNEPLCAAGKMEWIRECCPPWLHRQFFITPCKHLLARTDALLIDDHPENIRQFRSRGGHAILVPRPWNALNECDPKTHINVSLTEHFDDDPYDRGTKV